MPPGTAAAVAIDSPEALRALVGAKPKAILGFHARWHRTAGAVMASVAGSLAEEGLLLGAEGEGDLVMATLDVAAHEDLAFAEEVGLLPCLAFYRNGRRVRVLTVPDAHKALEACRSFAVSMDEEEEEEEEEVSAAANGDGNGNGAKQGRLPRRLPLVDRIERGKPLLLFVAGDRSKVGKSSMCLGLMGALLRVGFEPHDLAYIKPATQCESPQLVTKWCDALGVANRGVGPVVFYKGFTREFLKGNVGTSADLLHEAREAVQEIGRGKKLVMIDGVGYPAVGSIVGVSNADLAQALGPFTPILLVGRPGVGDAVDSFNLNATFFRHRGLRVLGAVFNRLPLEGFYALEHCKEAVSQYFARFQPESVPYGFVPELPELLTVREEIDQEHASQAEIEATREAQRMAMADLLIDTFAQHVDLPRLLQDAYNHAINAPTTITAQAIPAPAPAPAPPQQPYMPLVAAPPTPPPAVAAAVPATAVPAHTAAAPPAPMACAFVPGGKRKAREEIEAEARAKGAKKGA